MNKSAIITAVIMLTIGVGLGYWLSPGQDFAGDVNLTEEKKPLYYRSPMDPSVTSATPAKDAMGMDYIAVYSEEVEGPKEKKILYYRSPMNPSVTSQVPAKDAMGMDYVAVYAEPGSKDTNTGTVNIDPAMVQKIGVRTEKAQMTSLSRTVRAVGRVEFDEERMARLHPKVDGWIEDIYVDKTGQDVKQDAMLLSIYSPKLVSTQQEYLLALNNMAALKESPIDDIRKGAVNMVNSSLERLRLLDVPEHQIRELESSRKIKKMLHIHTPVSGTVIRIGARQGQFVTPKTELYTIVDLNQVWVYADVYEYELPWIKIGDAVEITLASLPGKTFKSSVEYIYPYAESKTRTTKVRMVFDNPDLLLRPDVFAEVVIHSDTQDNAIVIPSQAVVRSGDRAQVFVVRAPGKFEPRVITLGIESKGLVTVLDGVQAGDEVVTSAQFLVDSESKLREATAKMMESLKQSTSNATNHRNKESSDHPDNDMKNSGKEHQND